ncbi:hypothetical protein EI545_02700 [Tabrizicola piscis]|uniref:Uncharacterized protein n=1 Tax=Tabrizicola piscis TaxID=2494374 RepID=A0A3S8U2K3_9RHOB|nr:hypothetical protein [Tabrizicola piscis]AZL57841.1 hypothetical protein EI545_02700 [Tabrizicola piscis]
MFLRDFFLWRKPVRPETASPDVALALLEVCANAEHAGTADTAAPTRSMVLQLEPYLDAPEPVVAEPVAVADSERRHAMVLRRITPLPLPAKADATARQEALLERLCIVHDPNEVVVTGQDRVARILMVNRRMMSARFSLPGQVDEVFSFQKKRASKRAAKDVADTLLGFCADPVDLVVTERPMSGVFDVAAGLAVSDIASVQRGEMEPDSLAEADLEAVAG